MKLESKSKLIVMAMFCMAFLFLGFSPKKISPRLQEKLNNAVQSTFEVEGFELQWIKVEEAINARTKVELGNENLFRVEKAGALIGYAYLGEAPSMKNVFDYVVLFNPDLSIKKSKVLIYREDYGRQIGSQRWLKQFIGKKSGDTITYGEDVDAISGATISAKSMTVAVNAVLSTVEVLKKSQIL